MPRSFRSAMLRAYIGLAALSLSTVRAANTSATAEPSGNQILMGVWVDTVDDGTTPLKFNSEMGQNFSVYQISQDMPLPDYNYTTGAGGPAPEYLIEQTETDAAVFLTVYPTTFDLSDDDYSTLGYQLKNYTDSYNRTAFLRFAPEMQGDWFPYGFQPVAFKAMWLDMYPKVKAIAPKAIIIWAPNEGLGYPYSQSQTNATELAALDTSGDSAVSDLDDPFSPWYPGDDYVDWIGLSVYYKGPNYTDVNTPQSDGFCYDLIQNIDYNTKEAGVSNFYETYCTKSGKACMFAESGAAYHVDVSGGSTQMAMQSAWWNDCLLNETFYDTFDRIKLMMHFEFEKNETASSGDGYDLRDYRLGNDSAIRSSFSADLSSFATRVSWANYRTLMSDVPSSGVPSTVTGGGSTSTTNACTKYCGQVTFGTARNTNTSPPSLFSNTRSSATRLQATAAVIFTSMAMIGAASWLSGKNHRQVAA